MKETIITIRNEYGLTHSMQDAVMKAVNDVLTGYDWSVNTDKTEVTIQPNRTLWPHELEENFALHPPKK